MTIRELQYAIQDVIDEKGVCDNAPIKVVTNKDGTIDLTVEEVVNKPCSKGRFLPITITTRLGRV